MRPRAWLLRAVGVLLGAALSATAMRAWSGRPLLQVCPLPAALESAPASGRREHPGRGATHLDDGESVRRAWRSDNQ